MSSIEIKSFKRLTPITNEKHQQNLARDPILFNVLMYASVENQHTQNFERWILNENRQTINFIKLIDKKSIIHVIRSVLSNKNKNTYFITTQQLTEEIETILTSNASEQQRNLLKQLKFILLVDQIQKIQPINFFTDQICLITTSEENIKKFIEDQKQNIAKVYLEQTSSINTQNLEAFQNKFNSPSITLNLPTQSPKKQQKNTSQIIFNDSPGVGTYHLNTDTKLVGLSGSFSKSKR